MDKATPTPPPATVDSVMALLIPCCAAYAKWKELGKRGRTAEEEDAALREMRDAQEAIRTEIERLDQVNDAPNVSVESVMSIAFELSRIREEHGAQSGMYLSEVRALRAEVERLAAQAAPTERAPVVQATWPQEVQPDGTVNAVDPADMGASSGAAQAAPRCVTCDGTGEVHRADGTWVGTCFCAEGKRAATTQAVRVLTREELNDVALSEKVGWGPGEYVEAVQRKFAEVNGLRIPADGKIGGAA